MVKKIEFYQLLLLEMMNKIITKDIDVNKSNKNQLESNKLHAQRVNRKNFFGTSNGTSKAGLDSCLLGSSIQCIRMSRQTPTFTYVSEGAHDDVATCGSNKHMSLMDISTGHVILVIVVVVLLFCCCHLVVFVILFFCCCRFILLLSSCCFVAAVFAVVMATFLFIFHSLPKNVPAQQ